MAVPWIVDGSTDTSTDTYRRGVTFMARSLVVIGDGRGDVHVAATPDAAGLLGRLQKRYPRNLSILHEEPDAGCLVIKVHERLAGHRLLGDWFEVPGAVEQVCQVITEVDDRHHTHEGPPSYAAYAQGCRHPKCADERAAYSRKHKKAKVLSPKAPDSAPPPPAPIPPPVPQIFGPDDKRHVLNHLKANAMPNGCVTSYVITGAGRAAGITTDQVAAVVASLEQDGTMFNQGDYYFLKKAK